MRVFFTLLLLLLANQLFAFQIKGRLNPNGRTYKISLYVIYNFSDMRVLNAKNLAATTHSDSLGNFVLHNDLLPVKDGLYRMHIAGNGPPNRMMGDLFQSGGEYKILGGNFIFLHLTDDAQLLLELDNSANLIQNFSLQGDPDLGQLYQLIHRYDEEVSTLNIRDREIQKETGSSDQTASPTLLDKVGRVKKRLDQQLTTYINQTSSGYCLLIAYHFTTVLYGYDEKKAIAVLNVLGKKYPTNRYLSDIRQLVDQSSAARRLSNYKTSFWASIVLNFLLIAYIIRQILRKRKRLPVREENIAFEDISSLTRKELEILELIANGMSNKEIATQLFIEVNTIKKHISNIYIKLKTKNRMEAKHLFEKYTNKG